MNANHLFALLILLVPYLIGQTPDKTTFTSTFTLKTGQTTEIQSIVVKGDEVASLNGVLTCHGGCQVTLGGLQLKADEFYFHPDTGEAEARYNVRVKVLPVSATVTKEP